MSKLSIAIVAVPERMDMARALIKNLNTDRPLKLCCDIRRMGNWLNTRKAWLASDPGCSHHVILQEDVLPCLDFVSAAESIADLLSDKVVTFYSGASVKDYFQRVKSKREHWFRRTNVTPPGPAAMMSRELILSFLAWTDKNLTASLILHDEEPLWGFIHSQKLEVWNCVPTLVEHLGAERSSLGFNNAKKVSADFIGADVSGLSIDWSPPANPITGRGHYVNPTCIRALKNDPFHVGLQTGAEIEKRFSVK